jgi:hypothetical protein
MHPLQSSSSSLDNAASHDGSLAEAGHISIGNQVLPILEDTGDTMSIGSTIFHVFS